jgi:hypothetical protein
MKQKIKMINFNNKSLIRREMNIINNFYKINLLELKNLVKEIVQ